MRRAFIPDLLVAGLQTLEGVALNVNEGVVESIGPPLEGAEQVRLAGMAILPGLVTAHSHAFQRAIRGRTEYRNRDQPIDDFWTWREAMYAAAGRLAPEDLYTVSKMCFLEMARAGITCVGEFNYLHNDARGLPYRDANELDKLVARAARDVGLRVVLLRVAYARAGYQQVENPRQRRFIEPSADTYLKRLDALASDLRAMSPSRESQIRESLISVGAAPHSVRACPAEWIEEIAAEAQRRGWPLHMHLSEQPGEVRQCKAEHGMTPPQLLERAGAMRSNLTAVHAVHLDAEDIALLGRARAFVCACPTTERNLGDGIVQVDQLLAAGARISVGTDSEVQLSMLEDVRQLEYHLRLLTLQRAVLDPGSGSIDGLAHKLYSIASAGGMQSLGLSGGELRVGEVADFIAVDLNDPSIAGASREDLLPAVVFSMERTAIREVRVAGEAIVRDGRTGLEEELLPQFRSAMRRLWS